MRSFSVAHQSKSACSVAATYKPPMLVPRSRLPAGALLAYSQLMSRVVKNGSERARPDLPADLQSVALTKKLCTPAIRGCQQNAAAGN